MITSEQRKAIDQDHPPLRLAARSQPWPSLLPVWEGWWSLGMPAVIVGGGMMACTVQDQRAVLYGPRLEWLRENQVAGRLRDLCLGSWAQMDAAYLEHLHKTLEASRN